MNLPTAYPPPGNLHIVSPTASSSSSSWLLSPKSRPFLDASSSTAGNS
uniref:Uncharacterized protein n=1 Tax=Rhizophora mucronata TaxID=61149 RepID=A0A2P2NQ24_RHIMU